ncbi:MAG TPA: C-terminal helicase domain-containing protein, partial [Candidatus Saccharimonadales bacterium]
FGVQRLSDKLEKHGISSQAIHGNKSQGQRTRALRAFANDEATVLVATDVAARGLDIPNVSHVINYDTPQTYDDYVHRIGRTGRGGKSGKALTFIKK